MLGSTRGDRADVFGSWEWKTFSQKKFALHSWPAGQKMRSIFTEEGKFLAKTTIVEKEGVSEGVSPCHAVGRVPLRKIGTGARTTQGKMSTHQAYGVAKDTCPETFLSFQPQAGRFWKTKKKKPHFPAATKEPVLNIKSLQVIAWNGRRLFAKNAGRKKAPNGAIARRVR